MAMKNDRYDTSLCYLNDEFVAGFTGLVRALLAMVYWSCFLCATKRFCCNVLFFAAPDAILQVFQCS